MSERLCKDCKHYHRQKGDWTSLESCHALDQKQHPVTGGSVAGIDAGLVRMTLCGWDDPKFWEPRRASA